MVFLIFLFVVWAWFVLPKAREDRWTRPWMSARQHRTSMRMVAPRTESEIRRSLLQMEGPSQRCRERRREVMVFLGSGAGFAGLAGSLSDNSAAWPICAAFTAVLIVYVTAVAEVDRRIAHRRITARRQARALAQELRAQAEPEYAEAV